MKKSLLITEVSNNTGLPREDVEKIVNSMLESITDALKSRESVSFLGFGSFVPVKKRAREIYIPGTTTKVKVDEKYSVQFKPSKRLKSIIE